MWPEINWGGRHIQTASNIVFSNGKLDPWSSGGVLEVMHLSGLENRDDSNDAVMAVFLGCAVLEAVMAEVVVRVTLTGDG